MNTTRQLTPTPPLYAYRFSLQNEYKQNLKKKVSLAPGINELNGLKAGEGCVVKFGNLQYGNYKVCTITASSWLSRPL
jgi:hypothetical protein